MSVPGSVGHASPLKKPFSSGVIAPPKFPRSGGSRSWIEENLFRTDSNSNTLLPLQVNAVGGLFVLFKRWERAAAYPIISDRSWIKGVMTRFVCESEGFTESS